MRRLPELGHIDPERILFTLARSRADGSHGLQARIVPLRFAGGGLERVRRRGRYLETLRIPPMVHEGREIFYLITLLVPRFLRLSFEQRLATVIHELFHVSEACDGDLRRFAGRRFAHGPSRQGFHARMESLAEAYLALGPDPELLSFLRVGEEDWLQGRFRLSGLRVPLPRVRLVAREKL